MTQIDKIFQGDDILQCLVIEQIEKHPEQEESFENLTKPGRRSVSPNIASVIVLAVQEKILMARVVKEKLYISVIKDKV